jgi:O-antigen ligase
MIKILATKNNLLKDKKIEYWLILFLPFFAIFSIFILEVFLLIVSISFIYRNIISFEKKYFLNNFTLIFGIFYFYLLVRFLFSELYNHESYLFIIFYFRFGLYVISIFYFLDKIPKLENNFYKSVIFCIIALSVDGIIQFIFGHNLLGYKLIDGNRVSSFFEDESILGSYLLKMLPFLYLFLFINLNKKNLLLICPLIIITDVLIFISGERASFFLMLLMTFYFIIMIRKFHIFRFLLLIITSLVVVIVFLNSDNVKERYLKTFNELFKVKDILIVSDEHKKIESVNNEILDSNYMSGNFYIISPTHNNYFITSLKMFNDKKIVGHGPKSFRNLCKENKYGINIWSCATHPHNYYIQLLAEFGLIGFMFPFFIFVYFCKNIVTIFFNDKYNNILICIYSFTLINLWPLTSTGNFFNNWISVLIYIPFSFYLFHSNKNYER